MKIACTQLAAVCRGVVLDRPDLHEKHWWRRHLDHFETLEVRVRGEIGDPLPAEIEALLRWLLGSQEIERPQLVNMAEAARSKLEEFLD